MTDFDCDIVIAGGGLAGLSAAAAFSGAGFQVVCVDPSAPVVDGSEPTADLRTTAILQPGRRLLERAGLWDRLDAHAAPLDVMRIVDAGGPEPEPRIVKEFKSQDVSDQPFGWNLPNWLLRREMVHHIATASNIDFRTGVSATGLLARDRLASVRLSDGTKLRARLAIAADGRNSALRNAAGIDAVTFRYGQKALAFAVTHPIPHDNVSTEIHRTGGPFTLVPLPDLDGLPCSAVVWMDDGPLQDKRARLDEAAFDAEITARSCSMFGPLKTVTRRSVWPIITQYARQITSRRLALVAEAAHVVPPIGAQGLNMSLNDIATLLDLACEHPEMLGSADHLSRYERARAGDIRTRVMGIDLLNRASQAKAAPLRDARAMGINAIYSAAPVRRLLMEMGLGLKTLS